MLKKCGMLAKTLIALCCIMCYGHDKYALYIYLSISIYISIYIYQLDIGVKATEESWHYAVLQSINSCFFVLWKVLMVIETVCEFSAFILFFATLLLIIIINLLHCSVHMIFCAVFSHWLRPVRAEISKQWGICWSRGVASTNQQRMERVCCHWLPPPVTTNFAR